MSNHDGINDGNAAAPTPSNVVQLYPDAIHGRDAGTIGDADAVSEEERAAAMVKVMRMPSRRFRELARHIESGEDEG